MNPLQNNVAILYFIFPSICMGILLIGFFIYLYIYKRLSSNLSLSVLLLAFLSLLYVISEILILTNAGIYQIPGITFIYNKLQHIVVIFFAFAFPYYLGSFLTLNKRWQSINRIIIHSGLIFSIIIATFTFVLPGLFIPQHAIKEIDSVCFYCFSKNSITPGMVIKNIVLLSVIFYGLVSMVIEAITNKTYIYIIPPLVGIFLVLSGAIDDIFRLNVLRYAGIVHAGVHATFIMGITLFISLTMANSIKLLIDNSKKLEKANLGMDSALRVLQQSENRFKQLVDNINQAFMIYDYNNNIFLYVSPAYEKIWGRSCVSLYETPSSFFDSIYKDDKEWLRENYLQNNINQDTEFEFRIISENQSIKWIRNKISVIKNNDHSINRLVIILEDITARKHSEEELTFIAYHDILTGLPNRRSFFERFGELIQQANRENPAKNKALFYIDLDKFKTINDLMGHETGDILLKMVTARLKKCTRNSDYLFRIGGDEFTIILNGISDDLDAAIVAQKLIKVITDPFIINDKEHFLGLGIGICIYPRDGNKADLLVKNADMALNDAKKERNLYKFFNQEMNIKAGKRLQIENSLRYAIERNEFRQFYQPLVNIERKIIGMEALIRWQHPELGLLSPDRFISIAESTGQIVDIGEWSMLAACRQIMLWQELGYRDITIAVNISAQQFLDEKFVEKIKSILYSFQVPPMLIEFEITESSVMENPDEAIKIINQLYDLGIRFSIDDFGTGYSSLSYLKRFNINYLKIDRSFIKDLLIDNNNTEITKAIIAMAHNLQVKVIAEGVETVEQLEFLKTMNCDVLQGFLFSRPVPANDFSELLKKKVLL